VSCRVFFFARQTAGRLGFWRWAQALRRHEVAIMSEIPLFDNRILNGRSVPFAMFCWSLDQCPRRAVKAISRRQMERQLWRGLRSFLRRLL
jgi:hypothetical protein